MKIDITDNTEKTLEELQAACLKALETCGLVAERNAKNLVKVDTGLLRNSITHALSGQKAAISEYKADKSDAKGIYEGVAPISDGDTVYTMYVGTNVEYGPYQELGTGKYYPGGRQDPWAYKDAQGNVHWTAGNKAAPFIKPAVADYVADYKAIIERTLKNG
jgi:hypothetical protein